MKTGLVLEGGAYRGIFTSGVLNIMRKNGIDYDYIVGVSAGAGNISDFVTGRDDIKQNYIVASQKHQSYGAVPLIKSGQLLNVDSMIKDLLTINDAEASRLLMSEASKRDIEMVCTNCITARPEYMFDRKSVKRVFDIAKASCSVPLICKPVMISGVPYVDGSVSDAIPVRRALVDKKCDKCVVVLTRREEEKPTDYSKAAAMIRLQYHKKYPALERLLMHRTEEYAKEVAYIKRMEKEGKVFIIRPTMPSIKRFEKNKEKMNSYYIHGIDIMNFRLEELKKFLAE